MRVYVNPSQPFFQVKTFSQSCPYRPSLAQTCPTNKKETLYSPEYSSLISTKNILNAQFISNMRVREHHHGKEKIC